MTLMISESKGSGTASSSLQDSGVIKTTATRTFLVWDDAGIAENINAVVLANELPQIGDLHDSIENLRVTKRDVKRSQERNDAWQISYSYEFLLDTPDGDVVTTVSSDVSGAYADMWRSGAALPSNLNYPPQSDIGGNNIDIGGTPTSTMVTQQTFSTTFEHFGSIPVGSLANSIGYRNSGWWRGFSQGRLVYLGMSFATKTANSFTRTDKFLFDAFAHCRQKPFDLDGDLNPKLDEDGYAESVMWVQPHPYTTDFGGFGIPY